MKRLIELEARQENLKALVNHTDDSEIQPADRIYSITTSRAALRQELSRVRKLQLQHMAGLETVLLIEQLAEEDAVVDAEADCLEEEDLRFPSSFTDSQREEFGWEEMAEIEMELRKCFAEVALEKFQNSVRIFHLGIEGKTQVFNTQKPGTQKQKIIKTDSERRYNWQTKYMRHYTAMVALGHDPEKDWMYQPIEREAVQKGKDATQPEELGRGKKSDAWWWRDSCDMGRMSKKEKEELLKLNEEEKRVRYFQYWAQWKRYDEEWLMLGAEFDRAIRS
ncbi:hypothetical protein AURDEDRAFT_170298 [Auricularia subglabra TFB-10046 SS5]|nr:hypothetical protein AURDEDRAFT_170298 [Auricularia subglabra TFB-10046 SS5]